MGITPELSEHIRRELAKTVVGQKEVIDQLLIGLLTRGHLLLEGVPGIAKTLLIKSLARVLRLEFRRIQCTPDLMPSDAIGTSTYNLATGAWTFRRGPIFTDLLLVDEINRTPPKTQAAFLEAMEERQVSADGSTYPLSPFFAVFATQNPIEFEGTYPLPEAELDRFLMKAVMGYPSSEEELAVLQRYHGGFDAHRLDDVGIEPVADRNLIEQARAEVQKVAVQDQVLRYIGTIAQRSRTWPALALGASPRAAVALLLAAKALAAIRGRDFVTPDEVKDVTKPVLRHRFLLKSEAELEGLTPDHIMEAILAGIEVPR